MTALIVLRLLLARWVITYRGSSLVSGIVSSSLPRVAVVRAGRSYLSTTMTTPVVRVRGSNG